VRHHYTKFHSDTLNRCWVMAI